jgi:hypothetical protein
VYALNDSEVSSLTCYLALWSQHGEKRAISTLIPKQVAMADLDWHPTLPVCCSANQEGAISLWSMKA